MVIRELLTKLGFEADERPLKRVEELLEGVKHRLEFLAAAEISKRLYEVSERFADWGRNLAITAGTIGVTTEELQKLAFVAERNGASTEEMNHSLAHLSRHLYEAQNGAAEASAAFAKAGFTPDQVKGFKTSEEALFALSDKLHAMPSPIARVATAQELLGRGGYKMAYLLGQGSGALREQGEELKHLGLLLSGSQVQTLERLALTFHKFEALLHSVGAQIAAYFAPNLEDAVNALIKFYQVNKDVIGLNVTNWLDSFAYGIGYVMGIVLTFAQVLLNLDKRFDPNGNLLKWGLRFAGSAGGLLLVVKILGMFGSVLGTLLAPLGWVTRAIMLLTGEGFGGILVAGAAAAVVLTGVALAVQAIWASANGKESWLSGISKSLNEFIETGLGPFTDKLSKWGENLGQRVSAALLSTDWSKIADQILTALGGVFVVATRIGLSIGEGIFEGVSKVIQEKFPKLYEFFFPTKGAEREKGLKEIQEKFPDFFKKFVPQEDQDKIQGDKNKASEDSIDSVIGAKKRQVDRATSDSGASIGGPSAAGLAALGASQVFNVEMEVNVTAPAGDSQTVAQVVVDRIKDHWGQMMREASRSLSTQVVT